ncbi:hypothetical protein DAPPUDRAFT_324754 [Daphnia pulex]|uniref:Uncharacterized protein n=1 Tax=Daphnia pulex TaxID=6669 RepID=E9H2L6_DAPPU|nr:hypothetical protein DAPPUDRAFT_324754 [Daphnia pulex]|eukprot:EFX73996.1 hypothetical protein DAPPUDRAFT_324754 [Daphnia pulex]
MAKVNFKKYYGAFEGDVIIEEILQIELDQNDAIIKESQFDLDATLINLSVSDDN